MMADDHSKRVSRRGFLATTGAASAIAVAGCTENPSPGDDGGTDGQLSGQIKIAGSSTVFPLAVQMRKAFQTDHPDVGISVKSTGTGGGFANHFCPGHTDFNNASRPIKDQELNQCQQNGVEPVELKVATDAVTVIVNNDADWFTDGCITVDTLSEIWSPESPAQRWSDLKSEWPDEPIKLFGPTEASGTFDFFTDVIVGEAGKSRTDYQATEQDNTIITGVSKNEFAMGYLGFAYYTENKEAVTALGIDDGTGCVKPSLETAKNGEYAPLSRPLFTYPAKSALAEDHIAEFAKFWVEHSTSDEIVAQKVGYVPNSEEEKTTQMQALEKAIDEVNG